MASENQKVMQIVDKEKKTYFSLDVLISIVAFWKNQKNIVCLDLRS